MNGIGVVAPSAGTYVDARGWKVVEPAAAAEFREKAKTVGYVPSPPPSPADAAALIVELVAGQLSAGSWIDEQLKRGRVVLAGAYAESHVEHDGIVAISKDKTEAIRQMSQVLPVLAEPTAVGIGPVLVGVAVVLVAGGWLLFRAHRHQPRRRR